jgi:hypothetical protein
MRWAWLWASALTASTLLASAPGFARVPTRLVYARTPEASDCPDEAALAAAVAARLGYEPFSPWGDQTILATVTRRGGALVGRAELVDHDGIAQGSREVQNPQCNELILALALAISITLDPLHVASPAPAAPSPPAALPMPPDDIATPQETRQPVVSPPVTPRDRTVVLHRSPKAERMTWHVGAAAIGALEAAPHLALGGRLALTARRGRWSLSVEGLRTLPSTQSGGDGGQVQVTLLSAALAPCFRLVGGFSLCGLGSLGWTRAEGQRVDSPRAESVLHATAGGRALLGVPLGPTFELSGNLDVAANLNRPSFQLDNADVWRPGPLVAMLGIGASARFF